jgi:hypothetical protein
MREMFVDYGSGPAITADRVFHRGWITGNIVSFPTLNQITVTRNINGGNISLDWYDAEVGDDNTINALVFDPNNVDNTRGWRWHYGQDGPFGPNYSPGVADTSHAQRYSTYFDIESSPDTLPSRIAAHIDLLNMPVVAGIQGSSTFASRVRMLVLQATNSTAALLIKIEDPAFPNNPWHQFDVNVRTGQFHYYGTNDVQALYDGEPNLRSYPYLQGQMSFLNGSSWAACTTGSQISFGPYQGDTSMYELTVYRTKFDNYALPLPGTYSLRIWQSATTGDLGFNEV